VHLVGFIIRIYHDTRSPERQTDNFGMNLFEAQLVCSDTSLSELFDLLLSFRLNGLFDLFCDSQFEDPK